MTLDAMRMILDAMRTHTVPATPSVLDSTTARTSLQAAGNPEVTSIDPLLSIPGVTNIARVSNRAQTALPDGPIVMVVKSAGASIVIALAAIDAESPIVVDAVHDRAEVGFARHGLRAVYRFVVTVKPDLHMLPGDPALAPAGGDAVEPNLAQDDHVPQCRHRQQRNANQPTHGALITSPHGGQPQRDGHRPDHHRGERSEKQVLSGWPCERDSHGDRH